ncbi:MAG TPA: RNB domain-containing ribonuclease [Sorangium sp.]|nr:RNB domain-containing ribonuclease [Sorangium sp.]
MTTDKPQGILSINPRGFGFVRRQLLAGNQSDGGAEQAQSAFVAPPELAGLLDGDRVEGELVEDRMGYRMRALTLVERRRKQLFGQVVEHGGKRMLAVDPEVSNEHWPLLSARKWPLGCWVVGKIERNKVRVVRTVEAADASLQRVIARHELPLSFPEVPAMKRLPRGERARRRDLRSMVTVTIDAPYSRDLDDAVAALPADSEGGVRVFVSIADVDALVPAGSVLDEEAKRRGTSVYLPGQVIAMLPPSLSEDALSLLPGVERPTLTVELRIDPEGIVTSVDLYESVIRSHGRLSYEQVAGFLDAGEQGDIDDDKCETLRWLRTAVARLDVQRSARGGVALLRDEVRVHFDAVTREPTGLSTRSDNNAHRLIERLMVAANEAVACWLNDRGVTSLYRVHDAPAPEKVEQLGEAARNFGIEAGLRGELSPRGLAAFERQISGRPNAAALTTVLGSMLGPARYAAVPGPHYGLAAPLYTHFTSPIRRYADLTVHRLVKAYLRGGRDTAGDREGLAAVAAHITSVSRRAAKAERERLRMLTARLFAKRVGEQLRGHVVAVRPFGLVVQLENMGVSGTVGTDKLPGKNYRVDRDFALVGDRHSYRIGQPLDVVVALVDEVLGRIELSLPRTKRAAPPSRTKRAAAPSRSKGRAAPSRSKGRASSVRARRAAPSETAKSPAKRRRSRKRTSTSS